MPTNSDMYTPILPFDITFGESFAIYQQMTYKQDKDLCGIESIRIESGNVYKYYTLTETKPVKIGEVNEATEQE